MNLDEARRVWRSQTMPEGPKMSESEMLQFVKRESSAFDRTIARRDRREVIAGIVVAVLFFPLLVDGPWLSRVGVLVVLAAVLLIHRRLAAARRVEASERVDLSLAELLETERTKVNGQIRLLESVVSWYIIPPAVGAMLVVIGLDGLSWFTAGYTVFTLAVSVIVYRMNRLAVRHDLRPRRAELERLIHELKA
jgi:Ca2+/Na+ antiporter